MESFTNNSSENSGNSLELFPILRGAEDVPRPHGNYVVATPSFDQQDHSTSILNGSSIGIESLDDLISHDTQALICSDYRCDTCSLDPYTLSPDAAKLSIASNGFYSETEFAPQNLEFGKPAVLGGVEAGFTTLEIGPSLEPQCSRARAKFTPEEDQFILHLRRNSRTWKEIAELLPGRSPGALQVRYSTKLKSKSSVWTTHLVRLPSHFPYI